MVRYRGTTAQRGLGAPHVADKNRLLALHRDGDPCWRCGQPMYKSQGLERDHMVDRALGGADGPAVLAHMACNRSAGARLGNQLQPRTIMAAGRDTICGTCSKPYHYAARACEVCGVHYHPSGKTVRTCSRACGVELRRRVYGSSGSSRVAKPKSPAKGRYPGAVASGEREPKNGWPAVAVAYYTCRYCGQVGVTRANARQPREVCPAKPCQLARIQANNLRTRNGVTREDADAQMARAVAAAAGRSSRQW